MELAVGGAPDGPVTIEVRNDGEGIPEPDRQALQEGIRTQLSHGLGLGLWLVKWVVDNSGGRLRFPEDDGCRVRIELRALDR